MPNPKWRHSKQRKRKRRTHCKTTGAMHIMHHAYWHEGNMYYKGNLVIQGAAEESTPA
jgi:large subunit ribosomal protein L32